MSSAPFAVYLVVFGASCFVIGNRIRGELVEFAGHGVAFDFLVEKTSIKFLKPRAQYCEVSLGELGDCLF
jgi:hypothetical protein